MFAFQFIADAIGVTRDEGKVRWDQAQTRLKRRGSQLPPTIKIKPVAGARQSTPQLAANDAAKALSMVLKEPLKEFFDKEDKLIWLRTQVQDAGGDPSTVDGVLASLNAEKTQQEEDVQGLLLVLPGLNMVGVSSSSMSIAVAGMTMRMRTVRNDGGEVLGSVLDYLRWLGVEDDNGNTWNHWLGEEFRRSSEVSNFEISGVIYAEKQFSTGQGQRLTPFTNFAGYRLLTKLCLHKSKIAQEMYDQALLVLGQVSVGDQRLHDVLDANAAVSSGDTRAFVIGTEEAAAQEATPASRRRRTTTTSVPMDLDAFEQQCIENDDIDPEKAARTLAKIALARQYRDSSNQQLALNKRQKIADVEKYEAETRASKEAQVEKIQASKDAEVEKIRAERDKTQVERAKTQAERQDIEDTAKADRDERERQRVHAAELAEEKRRQEIRRAAADDTIPQAVAEELLGENRRTPILRFEQWISKILKCPNASKCSSELKRRYNASVSSGEHVKPACHRNAVGTWDLFEEHDGSHLRVLHQAIHDARNGVRPGVQRISFG